MDRENHLSKQFNDWIDRWFLNNAISIEKPISSITMLGIMNASSKIITSPIVSSNTTLVVNNPDKAKPKLENLNHIKTDEPVRAKKFGRVQSGFDGLYLRGYYHGYEYQTDADSYCTTWGKLHTSANLNKFYHCTCGFYGFKPEEFEEQKKCFSGPHSFEMEVEFSGLVVVCKKGYRASRQKILSMKARKICARCLQEADCYTDNGLRTILTAVCLEHAEEACKRYPDVRVFTLGKLEETFGVPVNWRNTNGINTQGANSAVE